MTSKILIFVLLLSSFGLAQGVAGDPGVGDSGSAGGGATIRSVISGSSNTGTSMSSGNLPSAVVGDLIFGFGMGLGGTVTQGAGFTNRPTCESGSSTFQLCEDQITASTTVAATGTQGASGNWAMISIAIEPSGTPAFVQGTTNVSANPSPQTSGSITTTSGHLIIACIGVFESGGTLTSVTFSDSRGNTYADVGTGIVQDPGKSWGLRCSYAKVTSAGATTVTANWTDAGGTNGRVSVAEYSGTL